MGPPPCRSRRRRGEATADRERSPAAGSARHCVTGRGNTFLPMGLGLHGTVRTLAAAASFLSKWLQGALFHSGFFLPQKM